MKKTAPVVMCILVALGATTMAGLADAELFLEPELGVRYLSSDAGDWLSPGLSIGGTIGYRVTPMLALTGHADFGLHASGELTDDIVESGGSLALLGGIRLIPLGDDATAKFQPYLGVGIGRGSIAWVYTDSFVVWSGDDSDALGAWMATIEGGGDIYLSELISLGVGLRYCHMLWDDETVNGWDFHDFTGASIQGTARLGIHFR